MRVRQRRRVCVRGREPPRAWLLHAWSTVSRGWQSWLLCHRWSSVARRGRPSTSEWDRATRRTGCRCRTSQSERAVARTQVTGHGGSAAAARWESGRPPTSRWERGEGGSRFGVERPAGHRGVSGDASRGCEDYLQRCGGMGDHQDMRCADLVHVRVHACRHELLSLGRDRVVLGRHEIPRWDRPSCGCA
jgi:hypothetical protein